MTKNTGFMTLGQTLKGTDDSGNSNLINDDKLGIIVKHFTSNFDTQRRGQPTRPGFGVPIYAVLLRNQSGGVLLGKRFALLSQTAGYKPLQEVIGYSAGRADKNVVLIDPWLDSNGVANNDIFWGIIGGPAKVLTPIAGSGFVGDIAVGNWLINTTGTTTGATTSGRLGNITLSNATDATETFNALWKVGRALSARTTGETNSDLLVNINLMHLFSPG